MRQLGRLSLKDIPAGWKNVLTVWEKAVRSHSWRGQYPPEERANVEHNYDHARQMLYRKIFRTMNGPNEGHVEQMKKDFRKLSAAYIELATTGKDSDAAWKIAQAVTQHKRVL